MTRQGLFWDVMQGDAELPGAAKTLGFELIDVDPEQGTIEVAFTADERFVNPVGVVQGGFLAGELSDAEGTIVATATATAIVRQVSAS